MSSSSNGNELLVARSVRIGSWYDGAPAGARHHVATSPFTHDGSVGALAVVTVISVWTANVLLAVVLAAAFAAVTRRPAAGAVCLVLGLAASTASARAWDGVQPRELGPYRGWATAMADAEPVGGGLRVIVEIRGERFQAYAYGSPRRRLADLQAGQQVWLDAERAALKGAHPRRSQIRHVVGSLVIHSVGDRLDGAPVARASNRIRSLLRDSGERTMPADHAALFTGLVIGDDTRQSPAMIGAFRAAGMSHLTAVSGQNVGFLLAVAAVGLRRLRPLPRWVATTALIGWFAVLTRAEPSVLRAAVMAMLSATAFARGRERSPLRLLFLAVILLVLVDPLLVWSIGFWLSVGATFGVSAIGPRLAAGLRGPRWVVDPLATTLAAQIGVLLPSVLVFGRMPVVAVPANLLAVPVAGLVMLYGIPAGLLAGVCPDALARWVMAPAAVGTRWVATVAQVAAEVEPSGAAHAAGWCATAVAIAATVRWRADARAHDHR